MQNPFTENLNKLYDTMSKPLSEFAELNMSTLNNAAKNTGHFEELMQAKKPEDFLLAQMKLANIGYLEATSYAKKAGDIWLKAMEQFNAACTEMTRPATHAKNSETSRQGSKK